MCALMKGARAHHKSKRMRDKGKRDEKKKERTSQRMKDAKKDNTTPAVARPASCHPCKPGVTFSPCTKGAPRLHEDDFLHAYSSNHNHVLHVDHTHMIALGMKGEKYYLVMVVDGIDFF